jgi:hypothetical protein
MPVERRLQGALSIPRQLGLFPRLARLLQMNYCL